jgi:hypothetical protein
MALLIIAITVHYLLFSRRRLRLFGNRVIESDSGVNVNMAEMLNEI